jgi:hypothetical protein
MRIVETVPTEAEAVESCVRPRAESTEEAAQRSYPGGSAEAGLRSGSSSCRCAPAPLLLRQAEPSGESCLPVFSPSTKQDYSG